MRAKASEVAGRPAMLEPAEGPMTRAGGTPQEHRLTRMELPMFATMYAYWPFATLWLLTVVVMAWLPRVITVYVRRRPKPPTSLVLSAGILLPLFLLALLLNMQQSWEMLHDQYATDEMRGHPWGYVDGWETLAVSGVVAFLCSTLLGKDA
jgi:hypothetical protein